MASASVAQVHRARLMNGQEVAVKVQKPEIAKQLTGDLFTYDACFFVIMMIIIF